MGEVHTQKHSRAKPNPNIRLCLARTLQTRAGTAMVANGAMPLSTFGAGMEKGEWGGMKVVADVSDRLEVER